MFNHSQLRVRLLLLVLAVFSATISFAQEQGNNAGLNEVMRSNDKIYVVMAVCLTILCGLIFYAIRIERKIKNIEQGNR